MPDDPIKQLENSLKRVIRSLPRKVGTEVVNFALGNFKRQGFLGNSVQPWQPRKQKDTGRSLLVKRGNLRRSYRILRADGQTVVVGSDLPYAKVQNEGFRGTVTVKAHERNIYHKTKWGKGIFSIKTKKEKTMTITNVVGVGKVKSYKRKMNIPKRQSLGPSPYLDANIKRLIALEIMKAARNI